MHTCKVLLFFSLFFLSSCNNVNFMLNNEDVSSAIKQITEAETRYKADSGRYGSLHELYEKGLISKNLTKEIYSGHKLEFSLTDNGYVFTVTPVKYGNASTGTGILSLYTDESREVRGDDKKGAKANKSDPFLQKN